VAASVAGPAVHPVRLQAASAVPASQQTHEQVAPFTWVAGCGHGADALCGDEVGLADQSWMREVPRDDPLVGAVPPQHLPPIAFVVVGALAVPDLTASDHSLFARWRLRVGVHDGRTRDALLVEAAGDAGDTVTSQPPGEDPHDGWCGDRVGFEAAQPPPPNRMGRVGVRPASMRR
jgi:hypothetical protein